MLDNESFKHVTTTLLDLPNATVLGTRVLGMAVVRVKNSRGASREQASCVSGTHPDTRVGNTCLL